MFTIPPDAVSGSGFFETLITDTSPALKLWRLMLLPLPLSPNIITGIPILITRSFRLSLMKGGYTSSLSSSTFTPTGE